MHNSVPRAGYVGAFQSGGYIYVFHVGIPLGLGCGGPLWPAGLKEKATGCFGGLWLGKLYYVFAESLVHRLQPGRAAPITLACHTNTRERIVKHFVAFSPGLVNIMANSCGLK